MGQCPYLKANEGELFGKKRCLTLGGGELQGGAKWVKRYGGGPASFQDGEASGGTVRDG